jgi:hypothetical protein
MTPLKAVIASSTPAGFADRFWMKPHSTVHTLMHHAYASAGRYESGGQYMLGVPIEWPFYGL